MSAEKFWTTSKMSSTTKHCTDILNLLQANFNKTQRIEILCDQIRKLSLLKCTFDDLVDHFLIENLVDICSQKWQLYSHPKNRKILFFRLTPSYLYLILFMMYLYPYLGNGPYWVASNELKNCKKYLWTNLLYINNIYPDASKVVSFYLKFCNFRVDVGR